MDSDGVVVDEGWTPDISNEEILTWYKNMVTSKNPILFPIFLQERLVTRDSSKISQHYGYRDVRCSAPREIVILHGIQSAAWHHRIPRSNEFR